MEKKSGWQLSGDGPSVYEEIIVPAYTGVWAEELVSRACLQPGERILDVACGTGLVARTAASEIKSCDSIFGIDVNEVMIKKAQEIEQAIAWKNVNVTDMEFPENFFDVIFCQQGLQYFPDPSLALMQMNRVLSENGRILLSVWRSIQYSPYYESLYHVIDKYIGTDAASKLSVAYGFGGYEIVKAMFEEANFTNINISIVIKQMCCPSLEEYAVKGMVATPFFQDFQKLHPIKKEELISEILRLNEVYIDDSGMVAPNESYIVSATKGD